jgi:hypothetical protein
LASKADGKDVVKFHSSVTVSVSDCILLSLKRTARLAIGQAPWKTSLPIPTYKGWKFTFSETTVGSKAACCYIKETVRPFTL